MSSTGASKTVEYRSSPDVIIEAAVGLHQILPAQFFDRSGGHRLSAEQRLMLAMLGDAIRVYRQGALSRAAHKRMLYVDAERWIMGSARRDAFAFDFEMVCEALGVDPLALRQRLIEWKHSARRQPEHCPPLNLRLKMTARGKRMTHRIKRNNSGSGR